MFNDASNDANSFMQHKKTQISESVKEDTTTRAFYKTYECDICRKTFKLKNDIPKHLQIHAKEKRLECEECGKTIST